METRSELQKSVDAPVGVSQHGDWTRSMSPVSLTGPSPRDRVQKPKGVRAQKPRSLFSAMAAALINFLLMFGMSAAYGMIIFRERRHRIHRALGVKMCLSSAFLGGGLMSLTSGIPIAIGGTDLNPAVFYGGFVDAIADDLAIQLGLAGEPDGYGRRLAAKASSGPDEFCIGQHLLDHKFGCQEYHEQLRATTIFAVAASSAMLGLIYFTLGKLRLTRYMSAVPFSISEAFLSCIGYKVFKYALDFCEYDPLQFMSAAVVGLLLYFCKAFHIGPPAIVLPLGLALPLGIFWGSVFAAGYDVKHMRDTNWLFSEIQNEPFYLVWSDSVGKYWQVNFTAWSRTLPDLAVMLIVCTLDCTLKLRATETKLPLEPDPDAEIMRFGLINIGLSFCGSAVTYMQLKFNVISFGVMGNVEDRRAGILYALMCGACYLTTIEHFNYLPRLFLSALLFFAGAGFVTENLWGSRKFLHLSEWLEIIAIVGVFFLSKQLIFAVLAGLLLSAISFIAKYAKVPSIAGHPLRGNEIITRERPVGEVAHQSLMHIAAEWMLIIRLKGYVFFSSSQSILQCVEKHFDDEDKNSVPKYRRLRYVIFDAKMVDGMDASGALCMLKIMRWAAKRGVRVLWSDLKETLATELKFREILDTDLDRFGDLDAAVTYVEKQILLYKAAQQYEWMKLHPAFEADRKLMRQRIRFEPFREIFLSEGARMGCPWRYCTRLRMTKFKTVLCRAEDLNQPLYLVHSGAVALWSADPSKGKGHRFQRPKSVRRQGWFLNAESLFGQPSKTHAVAVEDGEVLCWSKEQWWQLTNQRPLMMMELMKAVMRQETLFQEEEQLEMLHNTEDDSADYDDHAYFEDELESFGRVLGQRQKQKVSSRQQSEALSSPIDLSESFRRDALKMLPQLQARITEVYIASALGGLDFFVAPDDGILPMLPQVLIDDLKVAFFTFAEFDSVADEHTVAILPARRVIDALLHVGIFHVWAEDVCKDDLKLEEFLRLGHQCHLARLCPSQMDKIALLCSKHDDGTGQFAVGDVAHMLKMLFGCELDVAINDAVAHCWGPETWPDTHVNGDQFAGIVSWYVKRRERDWKILKGIFEVLGTDNLNCDLSSLLLNEWRSRSQKLLDGQVQGTSTEEIMWAADWIRRGEGEGLTLDSCSFLTVFLTNLQLEQGRLPPPCILSESAVRHSIDWEAMTYAVEAVEAVSHVAVLVKDCSKIDPTQSAGWARGTLDLLDNPESSRAALWMSRFMASIIVLSVLCICLEPLISGNSETQSQVELYFWFTADSLFATVFSIELLLRLVATVALDPKFTTAVGFFAQPRNICDLIVVSEIFLDHIVHLSLLRALMLDRIARLFRLAKLLRVSSPPKLPIVAPLTAVILVIMGTYLLHVEKDD